MHLNCSLINKLLLIVKYLIKKCNATTNEARKQLSQPFEIVM